MFKYPRAAQSAHTKRLKRRSKRIADPRVLPGRRCQIAVKNRESWTSPSRIRSASLWELRASGPALRERCRAAGDGWISCPRKKWTGLGRPT